MEDRFKFRAWDGKTMGYQDEFGSFRPNLDTTTNDNQIIGLNIALKDKKIAVMQCTGLKDINGNLIYEGDILENMHTGVRQEVKWNNIDIDSEELPEALIMVGFPINEINADEMAIIGNIYKNPELLTNPNNKESDE